MTKHISNTSISSGYALTNPAYTPFYIDATATLTNTAGTGLLNILASGWSIFNAGRVAATGTTGGGIAASNGGTFTNNPTGVVAGYGFGVTIGGSGTVVNQGTITASQTAGLPASYSGVTHQLTALSAGIAIAGGGVSNAAGGTVSSPLLGVAVGGTGSLSNAGTILGGTSATSGYGVALLAGGTIVNQTGGKISGGKFGAVDAGPMSLTNQSGASIVAAGVAIASYTTPSTIANQGVVIGTAKAGIKLTAGGSVTNQSGGTIKGGYAGIYIFTTPGTVSNLGVIANRFSLPTASSYANVQVPFDGISFSAGGTVVNGDSATTNARILGYSYGIRISGAAGNVTNTGTIVTYRALGGASVQLTAGGTITNNATGLIAGEWIGVQLGAFNRSTINPQPLQGPAGSLTLVNSGSIIAADGAGDGAAVWMYGPGVIINQAGGAIGAATNGTIVGNGAFGGARNGGFGIVAYYQTTVINYGVIGGVAYSSAAYHSGFTGPKQFAFDAASKNPTNTNNNLIEIAPGSSFGGVVKGANGNGTATLELLSGASAGTVVGFGTVAISGASYNGYLGFGTIKVDNGARWNLGGTVAAGTTIAFASGGTGSLTIASPGQMHGTITGFGAGDTLTLAGTVGTDGAGPLPIDVNNLLTVSGTGLLLQFDSSVAGKGFSESVSGGQTTITVSCFARGTSIETPDGPVKVEDLKEGQQVVTHAGAMVDIVWIGQRDIDCRRHPDPASVLPVRVQAWAFGRGVPSRDLLLSPDHAVYQEGVLVPIRCLINGTSIRQETVASVSYFHIELPEHDVILAENLPVESYLDTGDRGNFSNSGQPVTLFPNFAARRWEMAGCAPLILAGPKLDQVKRRLTPRLNNRYTYY